MSYETHRRKNQAVRTSEEDGEVADSMSVRMALIEKMHAGEMTLAEAQAELKRIQRGAKKAGKVTRSQAYSRG